MLCYYFYSSNCNKCFLFVRSAIKVRYAGDTSYLLIEEGLVVVLIIQLLVMVGVATSFYAISADDAAEDIQAVMSELQQSHVVITPIKMRNAIAYKHHRTLMLYIKHGANVHDSSQLIMPLFCAALHSNEIALIKLIKAGSCIGRLDKQGNTFIDYLLDRSQCSNEKKFSQIDAMVSIAWSMALI